MVALAGLPYSGKSTFLDQIVPKQPKQQLKGTRVLETAYLKDAFTQESDWLTLAQGDCSEITLAVALAQVCARRGASPIFPAITTSESSRGVTFGMPLLDETFEFLLPRIKDITSDIQLKGQLKSILGTSVAFVNVWDFGVNRALYHIMPLIAWESNRLVIADFLDLERDGGKLREHPDLTEYGEEGKTLMKLRSRLHYLMRIPGAIKPSADADAKPRVVFVGTHVDKLDSEKKEMLKMLKEAIDTRAVEAGVSDLLYPKLLAVDARSKTGATKVKSVIEEMIEMNDFEIEIPLKWIFLRRALSMYGKKNDTFYIPREEFIQMAQKCMFSDEKEIDKFLTTFRGGCSILYCPRLPILTANIIVDPILFLQHLEKLYYPHLLDGIATNVKYNAQTCLPRGIICKDLALEIWGKHASFFLELLKDAGIAAALDTNFKETCPGCTSTACYFMPTLREKPYTEKPSSATRSLFVTFNTDFVPVNVQTRFVTQLGHRFEDIRLQHTNYLNATFLELPLDNGNLVSIRIIIHGDTVEIQVATPHHVAHDDDEITEIYSSLKTITLDIFHSESQRFPGMKFELALMCPNNKSTCRKQIHYLPFHSCLTGSDFLFCSRCNHDVELDAEKKQWIRAAYKVECLQACLLLSLSVPQAYPQVYTIREMKLGIRQLRLLVPLFCTV